VTQVPYVKGKKGASAHLQNEEKGQEVRERAKKRKFVEGTGTGPVCHGVKKGELNVKNGETKAEGRHKKRKTAAPQKGAAGKIEGLPLWREWKEDLERKKRNEKQNFVGDSRTAEGKTRDGLGEKTGESEISGETGRPGVQQEKVSLGPSLGAPRSCCST